MAQRYGAFYQVKRNDNLGDPDYWNKRFKDIDLRFAALEDVFKLMDAAVANVEHLGIDRVNATFAPLIQQSTDAVNEAVTLLADTKVQLAAAMAEFNADITAANQQVTQLIHDTEEQIGEVLAGGIDGGTF